MKQLAELLETVAAVSAEDRRDHGAEIAEQIAGAFMHDGAPAANTRVRIERRCTWAAGHLFFEPVADSLRRAARRLRRGAK